MHRRQLLPLAEQRTSYTSKIYHKKENACKKGTLSLLAEQRPFTYIIPRFTSAPKDTPVRL
ncbi:hypothetical protein HMPREF3232_01117 [Fannyhessea vaginae]|nr:hypothetical protein HMPREF3232_01117 [Fannyhessea vaginae]